MAMGTPSPSDNTVTLSATAVAGSGETLPMAASTLRDHTQDRTTYGYDTNGEYNRNGDSRSEMLPKAEQARSRSYYSTHGKSTSGEQENRGDVESSIRSEVRHERSSPRDEQLTGQDEWRGEQNRRRQQQQQMNQHPSSSSSSSTRQLVQLPPIRTQPPSSYYENGINGSGPRQRTHSTPHPLQLQHVLNSTPSPTSTTASTSASVSTSSTSYLMTPISHISSSTPSTSSAIPNARSPSTPVRRSPSSISKVLNTNQDVPTTMSGGGGGSIKHRTSPGSSPLLSHHLPYHHHPALSNSSPLTTPTSQPTPVSALSPSISTPRPTSTHTFIPLSTSTSNSTNNPTSATALASLERFKPLLQRSFPPSNPHTQHLYALAVQIVTSDWFLTQSMEPPLDTNDPLVMYEKILRPGESRFRAFLEMTAQRSYRCQFVLPGDDDSRGGSTTTTTNGASGGEDVEMADGAGEGDQDVCCRKGKRCERTEERLDRAQGHARQHFEYRPFVCGGKCARPDCTQRFYSSGQKDDHIRRSIPRRKECEACGKQISIQNVSRHMKVIHNQTMVQEKSPPTYKPY